MMTNVNFQLLIKDHTPYRIMGALLSLPLIPVQMAGTAIASFVGSFLSSAVSSAFTAAIGGQVGGVAARVAYALLFLVNSLTSWAMLSPFIKHKLELLKYACNGEECTGFVAVHRFNTSLGLLHLTLACILAFKYYPSIQNGWWRSKLFAYFTFLVMSFFVLPAKFWVVWGNYFAPLASFFFVFIGLILLVDAAHNWAEMCLEKIETSSRDRMWKFILMGSTFGMYIVSLGLSIMMYIVFGRNSCNMNQAAITMNLIFAIIASVFSVHSVVQEHNHKAGLAQSAVVTMYCTYLILSAVINEPDDYQCNPTVRSHAVRGIATVIGAAFTFGAIAYTTTRAASRAIMGNDQGDIELNTDSRRQALANAVEDGQLPPSALDDASWLDEQETAQKDGYNYIIFHIIFFLATQYVASILTINVKTDVEDNFIPVGQSFFASWVKICSSWLCYALYIWSLVAPVIFPDRF